MGIHRRSVLALALLALSATLVMVAMTAEESQGQVTEIIVTIEDNDRDQIAHPTDTEQDVLTFNGEIALDKTFWVPGQSVQLEPKLLIDNAPTPWNVIFDPEEFTYSASGVENFTATLVVPENLAAAAIYRLTFNVTTSDVIFYDLTAGHAQVTIAQYYKIGRLYSTLPLKVTQGEIIDFNITIINRGNGEDTFLLSVSNVLELSDAGLTVIYPPSSGRVRPGRDDEVKLQLQAADDAILSEFSLNLTITSEESQLDTNADTVTSGAEWTVVVEAGIGTTITNNLKYIIPGVIVVVVILVFLLLRRKKIREGGVKEKKKKDGTKGKKKGPSKGTKSSKPSQSSKPKRPPKEPRSSNGEGSEEKYYGE